MKRLLLSAFVVFAGCSGTYQHTLNFNPTEPIRVAVLPFAQVDSKGQMIMPDTGLAIDSVPVISSKQEQSPPELLQDLVLTELRKTALDYVPPVRVNAELVHHGFADARLKPDLPKVFAAKPRELCAHLLNCDAVLYGKVTAWDRDYYGLQSVNTVGLELKLVSVRDDKVLFYSQSKDSESRGLTKGPTGFSDLVIEPLRGLDRDIITQLAAELVAKTFAPLRTENRPEYLQTSPPGIFASSHDHPKGTLSAGETLTVLVYGSSKKTASFSIGNVVESIPMVERTPGNYVGEYHPLPGEKFLGQTVTVAITDQYGRTTKQNVGISEITLR